MVLTSYEGRRIVGEGIEDAVGGHTPHWQRQVLSLRGLGSDPLGWLLFCYIYIFFKLLLKIKKGEVLLFRLFFWFGFFFSPPAATKKKKEKKRGKKK